MTKDNLLVIFHVLNLDQIGKTETTQKHTLNINHIYREEIFLQSCKICRKGINTRRNLSKEKQLASKTKQQIAQIDNEDYLI